MWFSVKCVIDHPVSSKSPQPSRNSDTADVNLQLNTIYLCHIRAMLKNALKVELRSSVMIFVRYLSEIRYFESRKPIIPTGFRYCVKLHFRHFRFRFLSSWNCFNGLVRNLNLECAWRKSYHSFKRIFNSAFLSQCGHGRARRFVERLKPGQFVKETNEQIV